jgi:hypothetical protein
MMQPPPNVVPGKFASQHTDREQGYERNQLQHRAHELAKLTVTYARSCIYRLDKSDWISKGGRRQNYVDQSYLPST